MLVCASVRSIQASSDAVAFCWDPSGERFSAACGAEGVRLLWDGDLDSWIGEHADLMPALHRGEEVALAGRVLIPLWASDRLEGILAIDAVQPMDGGARDGIRKVCASAALALAGLREREEALSTIATTATELSQPLIAARGFTRLALDDLRSSPTGSSEYLSEALSNINRLSEVAVGLQHASTDA
jgi:signal transduction histidine kinase